MTSEHSDAAIDETPQRFDKSWVKCGSRPHGITNLLIHLDRVRNLGDVVGKIILGERNRAFQAAELTSRKITIKKTWLKWWVNDGCDHDQQIGIGNQRPRAVSCPKIPSREQRRARKNFPNPHGITISGQLNTIPCDNRSAQNPRGKTCFHIAPINMHGRGRPRHPYNQGCGIRDRCPKALAR